MKESLQLFLVSRRWAWWAFGDRHRSPWEPWQLHETTSAFILSRNNMQSVSKTLTRTQGHLTIQFLFCIFLTYSSLIIYSFYPFSGSSAPRQNTNPWLVSDQTDRQRPSSWQLSSPFNMLPLIILIRSSIAYIIIFLSPQKPLNQDQQSPNISTFHISI